MGNGIDYFSYLNSRGWKAKRKQALKRAGNKCEVCGRERFLEVHHKTYANLGNEPLEDLMVVCILCHEKKDRERKLEKHQDIFERALNTYASKKYGEDWDEYKDPEEVTEEFESWLEKKEEGEE